MRFSNILVNAGLMVACAAVGVVNGGAQVEIQAYPVGKVISIALPNNVEGDDPKLAFAPLREFLSEQLSRDVELRFVKDEVAAAKLLQTGKVEFAQIAPADYVRMKSKEQANAVSAVLRADGGYGFQTSLVVRQDSELQSLEDVRLDARQIAINRLGGLAGRFYIGPFTDEEFKIWEELKPKLYRQPGAMEGIRKLRLSRGKDARFKVDAVLVMDSEIGFQGVLKEDSDIREVWRSPAFPGPVIAARPDIDKLLRVELGTALSMASRRPDLISCAPGGGYKMVQERVFDAVREMLEMEETEDQPPR
ncbi:MAG: phosphate/phosphite/phosphonate ABC transporter substrate-binding protein [Verrucomicrobiia bacterium]